MAVCPSVDLGRWGEEFDGLMSMVAGRFARVEPRRTCRELVRGLLSGLERKTCWQLAEHAGHRGPQRMQRLLRTAVWDADAVRDDLRAYVAARLGHEQGILVPDETGFLKKGTLSVGVQRQYSGTAGRIENCQVAVFLAYVSPHGRALIDRRAYLPASWTDHPERCQRAGVPGEVGFATKPALAWQMILAALAAGMPAQWVAGDEVYGADPTLRADLHTHGIGYVLAIACDRRVRVNHNRTLIRVDQLCVRLPRTCWQPMSAGAGAKGQRYYDWAWVACGKPEQHQWLLIRRNRRTGELAFYACWSPTPVPLRTLVRVAGSRWGIEELFQAGKGQVGLDHYQVRGWMPWHRIVTLAMLALALLTVLAATEPATGDGQQIPLTPAEIRCLFTALTRQHTPPIDHVLHWSTWRRTVQARARLSHYRTQLARDDGG